MVGENEMKRKVGFWRWLLDGAIDLVKNFPKDFIEVVRDPFGEMLLGVGIMFFGIFVMPTFFYAFNIPILTHSGYIYLGILFGFAFLVILHGIYRD